MIPIIIVLLLLSYSSLAQETTTLPHGLSICDDEYSFGTTDTDIPFCVNGGYCKASWIRNTKQPCECLKGFEGPHCEFQTNENVPTKCQLGCENGGQCQLGASTWHHFYRGFQTSYGQSWQNPLDLQHCECPEGFTGTLCEIRGEKCGSDYCHHNGKCVQKETTNGPVEHYCDCSETKHAGEFCEHEPTEFCTELPDHNGHQFCANGGTCKGESYVHSKCIRAANSRYIIIFRHLGCNCPAGFVGPVCEFPDRGQEPVECNLQCHNHGICRKGAKDVSALQKYGLDTDMTKSFSEHFEHCVCPAGYVGLQCEYQMDLCPGGLHACLNGGECMSSVDRSSINYYCNCVDAEAPLSRFAGEFCEMESTQFCTLDGGKTRPGPGLNSYCTNGGTCRDFVPYESRHPGCECTREFEGENCQYIRTNASLDYTILTVTAIVALVTLCAMSVLVVVRRAGRKKPRYYHRTGVIPRSMLGNDGAGVATIDLIAQSLGTNNVARRSEYRERANAVMKVADSREKRRAMIRGKKPKWTQRRQMTPITDVDLDDDVIQHSVMPRESTSIASMQDSEYSEYTIEDERRKYWPNDAHNDASNPIQVFDEVSVDSSSFRDSVSDEGSPPRIV